MKYKEKLSQNLTHFYYSNYFEGLKLYYITITYEFNIKIYQNIFFIIIFFLTSCVSVPGINKSPSKKKKIKKLLKVNIQ